MYILVIFDPTALTRTPSLLATLSCFLHCFGSPMTTHRPLPPPYGVYDADEGVHAPLHATLVPAIVPVWDDARVSEAECAIARADAGTARHDANVGVVIPRRSKGVIKVLIRPRVWRHVKEAGGEVWFRSASFFSIWRVARVAAASSSSTAYATPALPSRRATLSHSSGPCQ